MKIKLYLGGPGTGKTYTLNQLKKDLQTYHTFGPTWSSALLINGETIYSYCQCACISKFKPKKFIYQTVFIDEVFLFSKNEFQKILQCTNEDTSLILFGDPFQIRQPTKERTYFYEAIQQEIEVVRLEVYHRCEGDKVLQTMLQQYRIDKAIRLSACNQFKHIDKTQLKGLLLQGAQIVVGRHKEKQKYLTYISQRFRQDIIYSIDGNQYRKGQFLYQVSKYGAIKQKVQLLEQKNNQLICKASGPSATDEVSFQRTPEVIIDFYTQGGKTFYPVVSAECITINVVQGQTLSSIIIDVDSFFETGSFYTAISRVRDHKDIYILTDSKKDYVFEADLGNRYCSQ